MNIFVNMILIVSSSTIDKMFGIYTFYENRTAKLHFLQKYVRNLHFFSKIGTKFTFALCSKIGSKFSTLSMVDELTVSR